ncbi:MAG: hypothetical protein ABSF35_13070 [Polyangia bacterium]
MLIAAWLLVHRVPDVLARDLFWHAAAVASGVLLPAAMLIGLTWAARGLSRGVNAVSAAAATLLYVIWSSLVFSGASVEWEFAAMDLDGGPSIERWTEAAWKGKPAKARGWAARAAFQEFGVRISYLDEAGAVRVFEPTPEQTARWEDKRKTLADFKAVRQKVAAKAAKSAWEGKAYLASLGGVFVFGSIGLLRRRKPPIAGNPSAHQE